MKFCILLVSVALFTSCTTTTTIYLVRHAEKQTPASGDAMASNDVELSQAGHARALVLKDTIHNKALKAIFATTVHRTQQTVEPTAVAQSLTVTQYAATLQAANALVDSLVAIKGKIFLVAGHSNTVPAMVQHLGLPCTFAGNIPENDYDNLFIITVKKGVKSIRETTYGAISP